MAATRAFGIDFGTSTTLVSTNDGIVGRVLDIGRAHPWIPSLARLDGDGRYRVGEGLDPQDPAVIHSPKSSITLAEDRGDVTDADVDAIAAMLHHVVGLAAEHGAALATGDVRVGCPAMWVGWQRLLLAEIATSVGLSVAAADLIDEPVAVGVAWIQERIMNREDLPNGRIVVFDAGGGTLDVAVIHIDDSGEAPKISVLASDSYARSGDSLDESVVIDLRGQVVRFGVDPAAADVAPLLRPRAIELKEALSVRETAKVALGADTGATLTLTRPGLEATFDPQLDISLQFMQAVTRGAKLREAQPKEPSVIRQMPWAEVAAEVEYVLVAGGMGYMPIVQKQLRDLFPRATVTRLRSPQTAVVEGLAAGLDYHQVNLSHPPFDFWAEAHVRGQSQTRKCYDAYTPLFPRHNVMNGGSTTYFGGAEFPDLPRGSDGFVRIFCTPIGRPRHRIPFAITHEGGTARQDYWQVPMRLKVNGSATYPPHEVRIAIRPNGEIIVNEDSLHLLRVTEWPTLRGSHHDFSIPAIRPRSTGGGGFFNPQDISNW